MSRPPWPKALTLAKGGRVLTVEFDDNKTFTLSSEYLRVTTGSAEGRGHGSGPRPPVPGKADVAILAIKPVGAYAVRLAFDDGHDTGLYSWDLLYDLGARKAAHWAAYLDGLATAGVSRGPQARD